MDMGLHCRSPHKGFAQPGEAFVGLQVKPNQVWKLADSDGFDFCDLHRRTP
jgi:hypothetical protein